MNLWNAIQIGFKEILAHKFRSLLTMLGVILGVASLVAMSALVKGMENGMRAALIAIGGLEKVRVEEQDIPPQQLHLAAEIGPGSAIERDRNLSELHSGQRSRRLIMRSYDRERHNGGQRPHKRCRQPGQTAPEPR